MNSCLIQHRRADSDRRQEAVRAVLAEMVKAGEFVTVSEVARRAGVHRSLIYRHPALQAALDEASSTRAAPAPRPDQISEASLKASLTNERERNRRLTLRTSQLERRLSEALGRETFRDAGLDDLDQTTALERRVVDLEQDNSDLRRQIKQLTTELEAAQHLNQQLTRQLNRAGAHRG